MATPQPSSLVEKLRQAVEDSGLSYRELARLAQMDQAQLSRFMGLGRDLTFAVAARLCATLGLDLVQVGPVRTTPLPMPPPTTRQIHSEGLEPKTYPRGQGKRAAVEGTRQRRLEKETQANQEGVEEASGKTAARPRRRGKAK